MPVGPFKGIIKIVPLVPGSKPYRQLIVQNREAGLPPPITTAFFAIEGFLPHAAEGSQGDSMGF